MDHSPDCPLHEPDEGAPFSGAVHAAAMAFLGAVDAPEGAVITILAEFESPDPRDDPDSGELIARITIGIGLRAQDKIAAEHAEHVLNRPGAPWAN